MDVKALKKWRQTARKRPKQWKVNGNFPHNGDGFLFYTGDGDGAYIQITPSARLRIGTYRGAIHNIRRARFTNQFKLRCRNLHQALLVALALGGWKLLRDVFLPCIWERRPK